MSNTRESPDIVFYNNGKAYLTSIDAYSSYFHAKGIKCEIIKKARGFVDSGKIHWKLMGIDDSVVAADKKNIIVHEYASLSVPPVARLKNKIKKFRNRKPRLRIFQNDFVMNDFSFKDSIPFFYRPVMCDDIFFDDGLSNEGKKYDFVYCGALDKTRNIEQNLLFFIHNLPRKSFLIVGDPPSDFGRRLSSFDNVRITGRVDYKKVPPLLASAYYGLNLVPDTYPFNLLMSTKLLEYSAIGLPVITLGGYWVESFEKETGAHFLNLDRDSLSDIDRFPFIVPDVKRYRPKEVIENSGILTWVKESL